MKTETIKTHVDLNKNPTGAAVDHAFFCCPFCGTVANTLKQPCESKGCEIQSVLLQMSCDKCNKVANWTHWEVH